MKIDDQFKVPIDYDDYAEPIRTQRPTVYKDGDAFCCVSGPDPVIGIFGAGKNPEKALSSWEEAWKKRNQAVK